MSLKARSLKGEEYGKTSIFEKLIATLKFLPLPAILIFRLIFHEHAKSRKQALAERALRYLVENLNIKQLQMLMGNPKGVYETWASKNNVSPNIEAIGENARLFWIGEKKTKKVILYLHGGAYFFPMQSTAMSFWKFVQEQHRSKGQDIGIVVLNYSLIPTGIFPTQLRQAVCALKHLLDAGVEPRNIQVAGDSAGGNLVLGLLSHILHPLDGIPTIKLSSPLGGAYLMSPWVALTNKNGLFEAGDAKDFLCTSTLNYWGSTILADVPQDHIPYIEANSAPESWFKGVDAQVSRVLITAGGVECLKGDIILFEKVLSRHHANVTLVVQSNGVHNDPFSDFTFADSKLSDVTPVICRWLFEGFE